MPILRLHSEFQTGVRWCEYEPCQKGFYPLSDEDTRMICHQCRIVVDSIERGENESDSSL